MTLLLNGQPQEVEARTLAEALAELGYADKVVATAVNGEFVSARLREGVTLSDGDRLEVVAPMQGG
ncbi:sulfur carrier protein ThiS [Bosea lathyri]|jgi:sulfur carrier protein|uniref:Sulfur carrier protein n=1 Tax=Bosea lathyri TaxID=1036778 RepID=A0A1H6C041_9HYPH|nr:sulfur carrier protein ThiS [Bosea lathyri]SEG66321.1 sulfur carrier protein [Bosea lathyri]